MKQPLVRVSSFETGELIEALSPVNICQFSACGYRGRVASYARHRLIRNAALSERRAHAQTSPIPESYPPLRFTRASRGQTARKRLVVGPTRH
ncbi:UNVERIFIED_ORG: hypothetical protein BDU10_9619 [Burkholderia sp. CF145]|nr:hypothetical protein PMI06_008451 [Burkholderia sp. BT03]SKC47753.1 hypothetical protein SAMN06266956_0174 [Paraburkholderia hospita]